MTAEQRLGLADEIFSSQPNLLGAVLALQSLGVPAAKQEFALEMLFLCYQAMKESGLMWPFITQNELENQMRRHTSVLRFYDSLNGRSEQKSSIQPYIHAHPEQDLLAWVMTQCKEWLSKVDGEESDKYVVQAVIILVSCIAFVPIPLNCPPHIQ